MHTKLVALLICRFTKVAYGSSSYFNSPLATSVYSRLKSNLAMPWVRVIFVILSYEEILICCPAVMQVITNNIVATFNSEWTLGGL